MSLEKKLQLGNKETLLYTIRPSVNFFSFKYLFVFLLLSTNTFFTFWFISKGFEGRVFYLCIWILGAYLWISFYINDRNNYWVLTTDRLFDIQKKSIFNETVAFLNYSDIEDVLVEKNGIICSVLNFGKLIVIPKLGDFTFEIEKVSKPMNIQKYIFDRKNGNGFGIHASTKEKFAELLKIIPDLSEAELTILYSKVNNKLLTMANPSDK